MTTELQNFEEEAQAEYARLQDMNYYAGLSLESLRILASNFQHFESIFGSIFFSEIEQAKQCLVDFKANIDLMLQQQHDKTHSLLEQVREERARNA